MRQPGRLFLLFFLPLTIISSPLVSEGITTELEEAIIKNNDISALNLVQQDINNNLEEALIFAAQKGKYAIVFRFITIGADVCYQLNSDEPDVLSAAAEGGSKPLVKFLIATYFEESIKQDEPFIKKALQAAIKANNHDMFLYLLKLGVKLPAEEDGSTTLLHRCASAGSLETANYLMKHGYHCLNDETQNIPTDIAVMQDQFNFAVEFIDQGFYTQNTLEQAVINKRYQIFGLLFNKLFESACGKSGGKIFRLAASVDNEPVLNYLLKNRYQVTTSDDEETALEVAIKHGSVNAVKLLAPHFKIGMNEFRQAVLHNQLEILKHLHNLSKSLPIERNNTLLHDAALAGSGDVASYLINNRYSLNALNEAGFTALSIAIRKQQLPIAWKILNAHADLIINSVAQPFIEAAKIGNELIFQHMYEKLNWFQKRFYENEWLCEPFLAAVSNDQTGMAGYLIEKLGAKVNECHDNDNNYALHLAAAGGFTEMVKFLQQNKADKNLENKQKERPIDIANGKVDSLKRSLLLEEINQSIYDDKVKPYIEICELLEKDSSFYGEK